MGNKGMKALAVIGVLAIAAVAMGASSKALLVKVKASDGTRNLLNAVDASTDAATLTVNEDVEGYSRVISVVSYSDADTDCTSITVTCSGSLDGTLYGDVTSRAISSGASTVSTFADTFTLSGGTETISLVYDVWGFTKFKCIHSNTGTCASDTFTVQWNLSADK